jgi:hypothetical protein
LNLEPVKASSSPLRCPVVEKRTFGKGQANPTRDKATIEVAVGNNRDVSGSLALLFPLPVIFTNLLRVQLNNAASDIVSEDVGGVRERT